MTMNSGDDRGTWFNMLKIELGMIGEENLVNPGAPPQEHETVLGIATSLDQRLFTYAEKTDERSTRTLVDARYCQDEDERTRLFNKAYELSIKAGIAKDLLWCNLKDEFGMWDANKYVGLRKDFVVVAGPRAGGGQ